MQIEKKDIKGKKEEKGFIHILRPQLRNQEAGHKYAGLKTIKNWKWLIRGQSLLFKGRHNWILFRQSKNELYSTRQAHCSRASSSWSLVIVRQYTDILHYSFTKHSLTSHQKCFPISLALRFFCARAASLFCIRLSLGLRAPVRQKSTLHYIALDINTHT